MLDELKELFQRKKGFKYAMGFFVKLVNGYRGLIQAKVEVGHRIWYSWVWDLKLPNSENIFMIQIDKGAQTK